MSEYGLEVIEKSIKDTLLSELNRTGLLYRLHSRVKDQSSIDEKYRRKDYSVGNVLMQDLIGFRIITYFNDDIRMVVDLCEKLFEKVELVYDEADTEVFKPLRKNMICRLPKSVNHYYSELKNSNATVYSLIDNTFEIQFRTTLSEGWHEVDHNLRYKCKDDWEILRDESRMLNGIYATLETSDQALKALFEDISYHHYKAKKWEALLRNKLRLKFLMQPLDEALINILNEEEIIGKEIFKINRITILECYINSNISFPITFNSMLYFINHFFIKNDKISKITPSIVADEFSLSESNFSDTLA